MNPEQIPYIAAAFLEELDKIAEDLNINIPITDVLREEQRFDAFLDLLQGRFSE